VGQTTRGSGKGSDMTEYTEVPKPFILYSAFRRNFRYAKQNRYGIICFNGYENMNQSALDSRNEQSRLFGDCELSEICAVLRHGTNGMSDPFSDESIDTTLQFLKNRLQVWLTPTSRYDQCVFRLIEETIKEVEEYKANVP